MRTAAMYALPLRENLIVGQVGFMRLARMELHAALLQPTVDRLGLAVVTCSDS